MTIALESPNQPDVVALIDALDAFQKPLYPPESHYGLDLAALQQPHVLFAVARDEHGDAVGCGAMVLGPGFGELKRMFVRPSHRGSGMARALLAFLEAEATARGCTCFALETGIHQPAALAFYARAGYVRTGRFGDYPDDPFSVFMQKTGSAPCASDFIECARGNPVNAQLLERLASLALPQCHLTAGCLFQAVWNSLSGHPPAHRVKDYDVFYFDDRDLSWEAEDAVIRRVHALTRDLGVCVEVKNQARVHLWYAQRFGIGYPALSNARDGIDRYLVACTCVGIDVASGVLYAPDGLADLYAGRLRMNPRHPVPDLFRAKADDYQRRWPWLTTEPTAPAQRAAAPLSPSS